MCTVFIAWQARQGLPLIVASNRDEFHQRPTSAAAWQSDGLWFGGRDEKDGGSWLGIAKTGRFAVITNYRDPDNISQTAPSRGGLVRRWLEGESQAEFVAHLEQEGQRYNGFNLLFGDHEQLYYFGSASESGRVASLAPGIYGLSNGLLDEAWPKVRRGKQSFTELLTQDSLDEATLQQLMANRDKAADVELPNTGVPKAWESLLSSLFIVSPAYGTRATTVVMVNDRAETRFVETRFDASGDVAGQTTQRF